MRPTSAVAVFALVAETEGLVLTLDPVDGEPAALAVPSPAPPDVFDSDDLVEALTDLGLEVEVVDSPYEASFAISRAFDDLILFVDGQEAEPSEHRSEELRRADHRGGPDGDAYPAAALRARYMRSRSPNRRRSSRSRPPIG